MANAAATVFGLALALELALVSFFTFWGLRWQLPELHSFRGWADVYDWADGCLDVWLQSVAHCVLLAIYLPCLRSRIRKRVTALRVHKHACIFVWAVTSACQVAADLSVVNRCVLWRLHQRSALRAGALAC